MRQAFWGKAEGWGELQPLVHEQCPSPCSSGSHPAWLLYLRLSACFLHEPVQAAATSLGTLLQQSLGKSCTCFPHLQGAHLHPSSEPPCGQWGSADGPHFSVVLVSMLGTGNQRAKVFFLALLMARATMDRALVFLCLSSAILKWEQEQGLHLPVVSSLGNLFCLHSLQ